MMRAQLGFCRRVICLACLFLSGQTWSVTSELISSDQQLPGHPLVKSVEYFGQRVKALTGGRVVVVVKAGGEAGPENEVLQKLADGKQALARLNLGVLADRVRYAELASLPYLFRSSDHLWNVLEGDFGAKLDAGIEAAGYVRLMYLDSAPRDFYCMKPIRSQADFDGRRIRVMQSKVFEQLVVNLGAKPVAIPFNKVSDALKSGQLDCADGSVVNYVSAEHHKITPYLIKDEHLLMPEVLLVSKKVWDRLAEPDRRAMRAAAAEARSYMAQLWKDQEAQAFAAAKKAGVTLVQRSQIAMTGIEAMAVKTYTQFITDTEDLRTVMRIVTAK